MKRILSLLLLSSLFSCSGKPPEIVKNDWMINYVNDVPSNTTHEELSCFLLINDPDGKEDLQSMYLINDEKEIYWEIDKSLWVQKSAGKDFWIGFNRFQPVGEKFESGAYRIQAVDRGGLISESRIYIPENRLKLENMVFPKVNVRGSSIQIDGNYPKYLIWFYDSEDRMIHSHYTREGTYSLNQLLDSRGELDPKYFWIYIFIESRYSALKSGPYSLNR